MFNLYLLFAQGRTFNATAGIAVNGAVWLGPACQSIVVSPAQHHHRPRSNWTISQGIIVVIDQLNCLRRSSFNSVARLLLFGRQWLLGHSIKRSIDWSSSYLWWWWRCHIIINRYGTLTGSKAQSREQQVHATYTTRSCGPKVNILWALLLNMWPYLSLHHRTPVTSKRNSFMWSLQLKLNNKNNSRRTIVTQYAIIHIADLKALRVPYNRCNYKHIKSLFDGPV